MFENEINEIRGMDKPVIIFGAKAMGMLAKKIYDHYNIKVYGFCDNDCNEWGKEKAGIKVLAPNELIELKFEFMIDICTMNKVAIESISKQLKELGVTDICSGRYYVYQYIYQTKILKRKINEEKFANTIKRIENSTDEDVVLNLVNLVVTEKCTLRCKNCLSLVPYFKKPKNYEVSTLINSVKKLASSITGIKDLFLFGGEPFLFPHLEEICEEISKLDNIICLWIITNGTLNPDETVLKKLRDNGFSIVCSDYGNLSRKKKELYEKQEKLGMIAGNVEMGEYWLDIGEPVPTGLSKEKVESMYKNCLKNPCYAIIDGELHICSRSAFGSKAGMVPKCKGDFINLLDNSLEYADVKNQIIELIKNKKSIEACNYCNIENPQRVKRAIQV